MTLPLEDLERALTSWRGSDRGSPRVSSVKKAVDAGYLSVEKEEFDYSDRDVESWVDHQRRFGTNGGPESRKHNRYKLIAAWYLDHLGHEMETRPVPHPAEGMPLHRYCNDCFERATGVGFQADVLCSCEDCMTAVEVGYTPARRLMGAYGLFAPDSGSSPHGDGVGIVRCENHSLDAFYTIPYGSGGADWKTLYRFEAGPSLPEPDTSFFADLMGDAFESVDGKQSYETSSTLSDDEIPDSYK